MDSIITTRGVRLREKLANHTVGQPLPATLKTLPSTRQIKGLHTFIRNRDTSRDEFIFYSKRLIRDDLHKAFDLFLSPAMSYLSNINAVYCTQVGLNTFPRLRDSPPEPRGD